MNCRIAGLGVSVPPVGDLAERCRPYLADTPIDIIIEQDKLRANVISHASETENYYLDSGHQFYTKLLSFDGMMLHSSCVVVAGYAYLFSGPCGVGKSTHTAKYLKTFPDAVIINDDKPALRRIDGRWNAFGTPWCGKNGINVNIGAPVAGICFLHRGDTLLRRLSILEVLPQFLKQTCGRGSADNAAKLMKLLGLLLQEIPVFEFFNHAQPGDEKITYEAMRSTADQRSNRP